MRFAGIILAISLLAAAAAAEENRQSVTIEEFNAVPYPQSVDITNNPGQAGIEVTISNTGVFLTNKNDRFILVEAHYNGIGYVRDALIKPGSTFFEGSNSLSSIIIAYPNEAHIGRNPQPTPDWEFYFI